MAPLTLEKVPAGHDVHVTAPVDEYVPAGHIEHVLTLFALEMLEAVPAGHNMQLEP
jgi:hypothetical protein